MSELYLWFAADLAASLGDSVRDLVPLSVRHCELVLRLRELYVSLSLSPSLSLYLPVHFR